MTNQIVHNWQPSKRLLALMEKNKGSNDDRKSKDFMARLNGFGVKALSDLRQALKNATN